MTYDPDNFMSQPDGKIVMEEHTRYVKDHNGKLIKYTVTRRFQGNDYIDSQESTPLSSPDW